MSKKISRRSFPTLVGAAATASALTACGGNESSVASGSANTSSASAASGDYKDTLLVATYGDQDTLDPQVNVTNDKVLRLMYDGLLRYNENSEIEGALAETWETSEDNLTWTFHLRKGVKFANGKELTSADVVATFDRLMNPDHPLRYSEKVSFLDKVEAVDDYTVQMTLAHEYGIVEDVLSGQSCFIMDKDYIDQYGYDIGVDPQTINGTGPYKITSWDADEQMTFEANENWWGGVPGCTKMVYKVIPEANSRAMALETGEVDLLDRPSVSDYARLAEMDGMVGISQPGYGLQGFQFNCSDNSVCKDVLVRQAISYAIDRETIVTSLYGPIGETATHAPVTPNVFGYYDFGVAPYDAEKAKELLAQAGHADGIEISLMTYDGYNKGVELAEAVKQYLDAVGINTTIESVDGATFNASLNGLTPDDFKWDMFIMGFGAIGGIEADAALRRVCVTSSDGLNTNNYGWYSNSRVDELLTGAVVEMDKEKRKEMYHEAEQIIYLDDPFAVYMNLRSSLYVMTDKVENFAINAAQVVEFEKIKVRA